MIGIIGMGRMGSAIAHALKENGFPVIGFDEKKFSAKGIKRAGSISQLLSCDVVLLCVKPKDIAVVCEEIALALPSAQRKPLFISIAAGKTLSFLGHALGKEKIIRAMPNLAAKAGKSITAYCQNKYANANDIAKAKKIFSSFGAYVKVKEKYLDVVTALSGAGPAYFFYFTQKLAEAGAAAGLDEKTSLFLAEKTLIGAACLVEESNVSLEEMINEVATPGGTTEAALSVFEKKRLGDILVKALREAKKR